MMDRPFYPTAGLMPLGLSDHGLGPMGNLVGQWMSEFNLTRLGSLVAVAGLIPPIWRFVHSTWREAYGWIRQFFVASVTIPGRDPLNRNVVSWVLAHVVEPRRMRFLTARTQVQGGGRGGDVTDRAALLKKTWRHIHYLPRFETVWFWHGWRLFMASRSLDSFNAAMCDPGYDGIGGEEVTISCLGWSPEPIKRLIETCRLYADRQTQYFVVIYSRDRYGMAWQPKSRKPIRLLDTVHFDDAVKQELLVDIRKYLDPQTKRRYQTRCMPYRRGYLFYGPPGTGKSSLTTALAGEFGVDLYEVKMPSVASDQDLEQMFQEIPPQCIVLLEDIDAVWNGRDVERDNRYHDGSARSQCTLSGLLNVLDGVGSQEGRIVIMTTNKPERLDDALVRPGRIDMKVFLGNISQESAKQMFIRMFSPDAGSKSSWSSAPRRGDDDTSLESPQELDIGRIETLATEFSLQIPEDTFTPSQLQGFFQLHLDSAVDAASSIASWVKRELSNRSVDEDIEILGERNNLLLK